MPFALVTIGLILIITGARDTYAALGNQIKADFTGEGNFITWIIALGVLGAVGYIEKARPLSHAMMALVIVSMLLSNRGFFVKFSDALKTGPVDPIKSSDAPQAEKQNMTIDEEIEKKIVPNTSRFLNSTWYSWPAAKIWDFYWKR